MKTFTDWIIENTSLDGVKKIIPTTFEDHRGSYIEIYNKEFMVKNKIDIDELQKKIEQQDQNSSINTPQANVNQINSPRSNEDSIKAVSMIRSYRQRGHLIAKLDPLGLLESDYLDELHPESFGFKIKDYNKNIYLGGIINKENSNIKTRELSYEKFIKEAYTS